MASRFEGRADGVGRRVRLASRSVGWRPGPLRGESRQGVWPLPKRQRSRLKSLACRLWAIRRWFWLALAFFDNLVVARVASCIERARRRLRLLVLGDRFGSQGYGDSRGTGRGGSLFCSPRLLARASARGRRLWTFVRRSGSLESRSLASASLKQKRYSISRGCGRKAGPRGIVVVGTA